MATCCHLIFLQRVAVSSLLLAAAVHGDSQVTAAGSTAREVLRPTGLRSSRRDSNVAPAWWNSSDTIKARQSGLTTSDSLELQRIVELLQSSSDERRLQTSRDAACAPELLVLLAPAVIEDFAKCLQDGYETRDMTVPGQDVFIYAECWCQHNMTQLMGSEPGGLDCCGTAGWQWVCNINCTLLDNPALPEICDEEGSRAKRCSEECTAMCLELDYPNTPSCTACAEDDCEEWVFCLEWDTMRKLTDGDLSRVCDERQFYASDQASAFFRCVNTHPMNTYYQRYNTEYHCLCDANLQKAAEDATCCGHGANEAIPWAVEFCEADCRSQTACSSEEAVQCQEDCARLCVEVHSRRVSDACIEHCMAEESPCRQYRTCQPANPEPFSYICDDGRLPAENGCCNGLLATGIVGPTCPASCREGRAHWLAHGIECSCKSCEESPLLVDLHLRGNATVEQTLWENGAQLLGHISRQTQLRNGWPTSDMVDLMNERNWRILNRIVAMNRNQGQDSPETQLDLQKTIHSLSMEYHQQIFDLAVRGGHKEPAQSDDEQVVILRRRGVPLHIVMVVVGMTLGVTLMAIGLRLLYLGRRSRRAAAEKDAFLSQPPPPPEQHGYSQASPLSPPGGLRAAADDLTIVVGQPVCPAGGLNPKGTALGAPVNGKGSPLDFKKGVSSSSLKEAWT